jgi:hypothetical protein
MAIRLSGSITRKVPIPGIEYSSQSFAAGMEIEINSADPGEVQAQLAGLYDSLSSAIDGQIAAAGGQSPAAMPSIGNGTAVRRPAPQLPAAPVQNGYANGRNRVAAVHTNGNGNGNGRRVTATEAQCRAIYAICKSQGLDMVSVLADFNVADAKDLHVKDASRLIDQLKAQNGNGAAH